ncbi:hypothetical protein KSS87_012364 [Heliosperma pusillum]|nr:hypothetical protein KSS87_012364 [Heliosperma pusillum]
MESDKGLGLNGEGDSTSVTCSVCLDLITNGAYGWKEVANNLKIKMYDYCIGSAFNMRGTMQCPNCRTIESGQWLYASGSTNSPPELSMDDGSTDTQPNYLGFTETGTYRSKGARLRLAHCASSPWSLSASVRFAHFQTKGQSEVFGAVK